MNFFTRTDLAWAAGFIDADGVITIVRRAQARPQSGHPGINIQHQALIQVSQRDTPDREAPINKLVEMFGGYVNRHIVKPNEIIKRSHGMITWGVASKKAFHCLELIYPYLVLKKKQADVVMQFHSEKVLSVGGYRFDRRLKPEELEKREVFWNKIRELNKRSSEIKK